MVDVVVHAISLSSTTSRLFELRAAEGRLPPFEAGAHVDLYLEPALIRQYSLCNAPSESHRYLICVKREPQSRGGSARLHESVAVGDRVRISPPRNNFALDPAASRHVLIGGGIGVTPLASMAHALLEADAPFELHHYCSGPLESPLRESLSSGPLADRYIAHHTSVGDSARHRLPPSLSRPEPDTAIYICGPTGLDARITECALAAGWSEGGLHREKFSRAVPITPSFDDDTFVVHLVRRGCTIPVPADRTIAEVLLEHDVPVDLSCEQGICGACLTPVLAGEPDHRDEVQTDDEHAANNQITVCCSRSHSSVLTLDL
jgi:vanillate O-demethylase ferredoxin subunit